MEINPLGKESVSCKTLWIGLKTRSSIGEAVRLMDEQRSGLELRNRSSNVVSFAQYRREHPQHVHRPTDKPTKPAA